MSCVGGGPGSSPQITAIAWRCTASIAGSASSIGYSTSLSAQYVRSASYSKAVARTTVRPACSAISDAASSSAVFPTPGSPQKSRTGDADGGSPRTKASISSSSASRPKSMPHHQPARSVQGLILRSYEPVRASATGGPCPLDRILTHGKAMDRRGSSVRLASAISYRSGGGAREETRQAPRTTRNARCHRVFTFWENARVKMEVLVGAFLIP